MSKYYILLLLFISCGDITDNGSPSYFSEIKHSSEFGNQIVFKFSYNYFHSNLYNSLSKEYLKDNSDLSFELKGGIQTFALWNSIFNLVPKDNPNSKISDLRCLVRIEDERHQLFEIQIPKSRCHLIINGKYFEFSESLFNEVLILALDNQIEK